MKGNDWKQKKWPYVTGIFIALILEFIGISSGAEGIRHLGGVCLGLGAMGSSLCVNRLYRLSYEKEFPALAHREEVEYRDERNTLIRDRARSKSAVLIQWVIVSLACLVFFTDGPLWIALALIGAFVLRYCFEWHYLAKYQKEM